MAHEVDCMPCGGSGFSYETGGRCRYCRGSGKRPGGGEPARTGSGKPAVPGWMPRLGCGARIAIAIVLVVVAFPVLTMLLIAMGAYDGGSSSGSSRERGDSDGSAPWSEPVEMAWLASNVCGGRLDTYALEMRIVPSAAGDSALVEGNLHYRGDESTTWVMTGAITDGVLDLRAEDGGSPIPAVRGAMGGPDVQEISGPSKTDGCTQVLLERVR